MGDCFIITLDTLDSLAINFGNFLFGNSLYFGHSKFHCVGDILELMSGLCF